MHSSSSLVLISIIVTTMFDRTLSNYEGKNIVCKTTCKKESSGRFKKYIKCAITPKTSSSTVETSQELSNLANNMNDLKKRNKIINKPTKEKLIKEQISEIKKAPKNIDRRRRQRSTHDTVSSLTKYSIYKMSDIRKTIYLMEPYKGSSSDVYIVLSLDSESANKLGKSIQKPTTNFLLCKHKVYSIDNRLHDLEGGLIYFEKVYRALVTNSQEKKSNFGKLKNFFSKIHMKQHKKSFKSRSKRQTLILTSVLIPSTTSATDTKRDIAFVKDSKKMNEVSSSLKSLSEKQSSSTFDPSTNATQKSNKGQETYKKDNKVSSKQINVHIESTKDAIKPKSGDSTLVVDVNDIIHEKDKVKGHKEIPTYNRNTIKNNNYNAYLRYARKYWKNKPKHKIPVVRYNLLYRNIIKNSKNVYFYHVIKSKQIFKIGLPYREDRHTFLIVHLNRKIIHTLRKIAKPSIQMLLGNEIFYFEIKGKYRKKLRLKPVTQFKPVTNDDNEKRIFHNNVIKTNKYDC